MSSAASDVYKRQIQSHVAPSHGPPARVLSPLSSWQSLSCCLSCVAKRSTPKPHGPLLFTLEPHSPLFSPQNCMVLPINSRSSWPSPFYFRTSWPSSFPLRTSWLSHLRRSRVVYSFLWLPGLSLNPSTHLPLQPHFRLLLQSVTPASIPLFFQLYCCLLYTSDAADDIGQV